MNISELIENENLAFSEVMQAIEANYHYTPCAFTNGLGDIIVKNAAGTNEGSCKVFAFAQLNNLSEADTLKLFGEYYREDVLKNPEGNDHGNIRTFMQTGWAGIDFEGVALVEK